MKNISTLLFIVFFCSTVSSFSQSKEVKIKVSLNYGNLALNLADSVFSTDDSSQFQVETLKFYISGIQLLKGGKVVFEEKNSFHLVDASDFKSTQISIERNQSSLYDELKFNLGIDSATNVSGAMGGDLDPTKGMYWTWQSGYINIKIEGKSALCKTRNSDFQFHLGGYHQPNYCLQTLRFKISNKSVVNLKVDLERLFQEIDLAKTNHIMSPSIEAVVLSKLVANSFSSVGN
jgi:hypothetical protein